MELTVGSRTDTGPRKMNQDRHHLAALQIDADPLEALGLIRHLSPTRRNGLASARARIRELARQAG